MTAAHFHLDLTNPQPGSWINAAGYPVDLLLPEAVSGRAGKGRSGRIPPHDNMSARRVRGIEGALVDHAPMIVTWLEAGDERQHEVLVAGPSALLVAKLHKDRRVASSSHADSVRAMLTMSSDCCVRSKSRRSPMGSARWGRPTSATTSSSRRSAISAHCSTSRLATTRSRQRALSPVWWRTQKRSRCAVQCWPLRFCERSS